MVKGLIITTGLLLYGFALYRDLLKRLKIEKQKQRNGKLQPKKKQASNATIKQLKRAGLNDEEIHQVLTGSNVIDRRPTTGVGYARKQG